MSILLDLFPERKTELSQITVLHKPFHIFFHIFIILFFCEDEAKLYSIQREQIDSSVSAVLLWKRQSLYDCKHQSACFHI